MTARTAWCYLDRSRRCELFLETQNKCRNNEEITNRRSVRQENLHVHSPAYLIALSSDIKKKKNLVKRSKALGALHLHKTCINIYYASVWLQKCIKGRDSTLMAHYRSPVLCYPSYSLDSLLMSCFVTLQVSGLPEEFILHGIMGCIVC